MESKILGVLLLIGISYTSLVQGQTIVNDVASLQSSIVSATEGEVIQLSSSFPAALTSAINVTINHTNSFIIDGNGIVLTVGGNYRHFSISKTTSTGTLTLKNMELKGLRTDLNGTGPGTSGGGVSISNGSKGTIEFADIYFNSIQNAALVFSSLDANAIVRVSNSTFRNNNKGDHGGAISCQNTGNLEVLDCTFDKNSGPGSGYSGGAIACFNLFGQFSVKRSVFLDNVSATWGGAIGIYASNANNTSTVFIDSCYFEGNRVTAQNGNADGGAVSVFRNVGITKFDLQNSTFYKNHASDDGGALFIQNYNAGAENYVANCTMYENYASDANPATTTVGPLTLNIATCGGAIQLSLKSPVTLENNTIIQNYTTSSYQRGGGIGFHGATAGAPDVILKNNIILGNYILNGTTPVYNQHSNVGLRALTSATVVQSGNIGYDNGTNLPANVTLLNAFGNGDPVKWENFNNNKIGNPNETNVTYHRIMPTISVKPNDGVDVLGLADRQGVATSLAIDGRGFLRDQTNPNIGAVEIRWAKFNANGGDWTSLPNLTYDGTVYYDKDGSGKAQNYYQITTYNGNVSSPQNLPEMSGNVFQYWALDSVNGTRWDGSPLTVTSNRTLYAKWRTGFLSFENDTVCEPDKADLTNLSLISGSLTGVSLSYFMDRACTTPVSNPIAVGGGTYYIVGVNTLNQRDTVSVDIIENKKVSILIEMEADTCLYDKLRGLILNISDPSEIVIAGTGKWFLDKSQIDPGTYVLTSRDDGKMLYYQVGTECGVVRSNAIEIEICDLRPNIQRPVLIPEVPGLKTSLPPGEHFVQGHDDFVFTMTPLQGYSIEGITVKTNNPVWDDNGGVVLEKITDDTIKVTIRKVTEPLILTIEGVTPTTNTLVDVNTTVWTYNGQLFLDVSKPMTLSIYTLSGSLYTQKILNAGRTILSLPSGVYMVMLDDKLYLKAIIK